MPVAVGTGQRVYQIVSYVDMPLSFTYISGQINRNLI